MKPKLLFAYQERKGVPAIPSWPFVNWRNDSVFIQVPPPPTPLVNKHTHLRDPLWTYIISILCAPQSDCHSKQMLSTDRQLKQMSCLGNGLSLSGLTEGLIEFQPGAFALLISMRKRITWIQITWMEDGLSKVGFSYIAGCTSQMGC